MIATTNLVNLGRRLENIPDHGLLLRGVKKMKMQKVLPSHDIAADDPLPVKAMVSVFIDGYRIDFEAQAKDFDFVTAAGDVIR